jgi:hypothetical protein
MEPIEQLFTLGSCFKIVDVFDCLFRGKSYVLILAKKELG